MAPWHRNIRCETAWEDGRLAELPDLHTEAQALRTADTTRDASTDPGANFSSVGMHYAGRDRQLRRAPCHPVDALEHRSSADAPRTVRHQLDEPPSSAEYLALPNTTGAGCVGR